MTFLGQFEQLLGIHRDEIGDFSGRQAGSSPRSHGKDVSVRRRYDGASQRDARLEGEEFLAFVPDSFEEGDGEDDDGQNEAFLAEVLAGMGFQSDEDFSHQDGKGALAADGDELPYGRWEVGGFGDLVEDFQKRPGGWGGSELLMVIAIGVVAAGRSASAFLLGMVPRLNLFLGLPKDVGEMLRLHVLRDGVHIAFGELFEHFHWVFVISLGGMFQMRLPLFV